MTLRVVCPSCGSEYTVAAELRGKKGRCRKCAASFVLDAEAEPAPVEPVRPVPVAEPERPARAGSRREREDEDRERTPRRRARPARKRSSALVPLIIVGGILITILAAVGAGIGVWSYRKSLQPAPTPVAAGTQPNSAAQPNAGAADSTRSFWTAALPPFENRPVASTDDTEVGESPPAENPGNADPGTPASAPTPKPRETPVAGAGGQMTGDVLQKVKRATFYLRVTMADGRMGTGSGFLSDASGVVVTNAHVLGMLGTGTQKPKQVEVFLDSGETTEKKVIGEVLGVDRRSDLGMLRIPKKGLPLPLTVKSAQGLYETQPLWVSGFPLGESLGKNVTVTACPVSSLRKEHGVLTRLQVHGDMQPGNSGGPVVDAQGDVVGVAVAIIRSTRINFAIPADDVLTFANGRLAELGLGMPYLEAETAQVPVTMQMHDPLRQVRKVGIELWIGDPGRDRAASKTAPVARKTDGPRTRVDLKYEPASSRGEGLLSLPTLPAGKAYWIQPVYEDGRGQTQWASANTYEAPAPVVRKPIHLELKPTTKDRKLTLQLDSTLYLERRINNLYEVGVKLQTTWNESLHPGPAAGITEVQRQYTDLSLGVRYNRGKSQESPLPARLKPRLSALSAKVRLDPEQRVLREEFGPELALLTDAESRAHLQTLQRLTQQKLDSVAVQLPGKLVQPGEKWKPAEPRSFVMDTFEVGRADATTLPWTFTYAGTRRHNGREVAVVSLSGAVTERQGQTGTAPATGTGHALIDTETGQVTHLEARLEARYLLGVNTPAGLVGIPARSWANVRLDASTPDNPK